MKLAVALGSSLLVVALSASAAEKAGGNVEHGRYLVFDVAMCVQCHTPRNERGQLIRTQYLEGAPMPVTSPFRDLRFATETPTIAGLPGYTVEEGVRLLTKGLNRGGRPPRPPMPPFRMNDDDARDVVAFLKSLSRKP